MVLGLLASMCVGCSSGSGGGEIRGGRRIPWQKRDYDDHSMGSGRKYGDRFREKLDDLLWKKNRDRQLSFRIQKAPAEMLDSAPLQERKRMDSTIGIVSGTIISNDYFMDDAVPYDSMKNIAIFCENPSCIAVPA